MNVLNEDTNRSIISFYGWFIYDIYDANLFSLKAKTDLFFISMGIFIVLLGLMIQNINIKLNKSKLIKR